MPLPTTARPVPECVTLRLRSADHVELRGDHYQLGSRQRAIVVCHGFFQHRRTPRFRRIAGAFAEAGYDVITFDLRGHGQSGGLFTFGERETADLKAVLDFFRPKYIKLGVLGFSIGASIAICTLATVHEADGLIVVSAVADPDMISPINVWWPGAIRSWWNQRKVRRMVRGMTLHYGKPKAADVVDKVSPIPALVIHGTKDWLVNVEQGRLLYARACEPKRLRLIEGGRHAEELFEDDPEGFVRLCSGWFQEVFGVSR